MSNFDKKKYKNFLGDIVCEYCENDKWCILKEILISMHPSERLLIQMKCIEKFKYEESKKMDKELSWEDATFAWVDNGYAKLFNNYFEEGIKFTTLFKKIFSS